MLLWDPTVTSREIASSFSDVSYTHLPEAGPSEPVLILGLNGAPAAGDTFHVVSVRSVAKYLFCSLRSVRVLLITPLLSSMTTVSYTHLSS